ncbi:MAG: hypothetical protein AAF604_12160 [Acidobacteriota bacterium]
MSLLDDVGRFVGGQTKVRRLRKGDSFAAGIGGGAEISGSFSSRASDVGFDGRETVPRSERLLNWGEKRQGFGRAGSTALSDCQRVSTAGIGICTAFGARRRALVSGSGFGRSSFQERSPHRYSALLVAESW